jgi:preprotein translocase subunit SecE
MAKIVEQIVKYLKEVKSEMMKVTWPTWIELKGSTILVILLSAFFAVYVGVVDLALSVVRRLF